MNSIISRMLFSGLLVTLAACGGGSPEPQAATTKPAPTLRSPGKPTAPVSLDYEILGRPFVGVPVAVNVRVTPTGETGPVRVSYSIEDESAMLFQEGQVERLEFDSLTEESIQQLALVPQREGRLYVNVSAEVETPGGTMIRSMAIPVQVGSAPAPRNLNGDLVETADGEPVISMPAVEN